MNNTGNPVRVYLASAAVFAFALSLAYTLQGLYFVEAGLTPFELLLIGAALEASVFLLEVPTAVVADVYSRRRSVLLGFAVLGLSMVMVGLSTGLWWLLLAQVVGAAGFTLLSGAAQAWLADEVGEDRAAGLYLLGSQYARAAAILGILGAAALSGLGLGWPLLAGGVVLMLFAALLTRWMPETGFRPLPREDRQTWGAMRAVLQGSVAQVRGSRILSLLLLAAVLYGASGEVFDRLSEFLLVREVGLPVGVSGPLLFAGLALLAQLLGLLVTEPLRRRLNPANPAQAAGALQAILLLSGLALLAFAYAPGFWWGAASLVAFGVLRGLYDPLYTAWLNQGLRSETRATVNSLASQADALGQVTLGPALGLLGNLAGVRAALAAAGLLRLGLIPVFRAASKWASR